MVRPTSLFRLYVVSIERGSSHPEFSKFLANVAELAGVSPDYGGIRRIAIVSSRQDVTALKAAASNKLRNKRAVTVEEITTATIITEHRSYIETVEHFFRYNEYPGIDLTKARKAIRLEHDETG